jgi:ubiquitin-protein ligase
MHREPQFSRIGSFAVVSKSDLGHAMSLGVHRYRWEGGRLSSPRLRRLAADYESVRGEYSGHPYVRASPVGPNRPPEAYRVKYRVRGLRLDGDQPVPVDHHEVEIRLPLGYPREKPLCTPLTPVFHPNIKDYYCIQDYWAAGQSLVDTIAKIADMIQYRIYNTASPLDALAARWAMQHPDLFPIGNVAIGAPEVQIVLGSRRAALTDPVDDAEAVDQLPAVLEDDDEPEPTEEQFLVSLRREG